MRLSRKPRIVFAIATIALGSASLLIAQNRPAPPKNLRIVSEPPPPPPPPSKRPPPPPCEVSAPGGPAHAYFDSLVRRGDHLCNWSLRDQAQLDALVSQRPSASFTYDYPAADPSKCNGDTCDDKYHDVQDGAKVAFSPPDPHIQTYQQLRPNLPRVDDGTILLTWDWYYGVEFRDNRGEVQQYKMFQPGVEDGVGWWTMTAYMHYRKDSDEMGKHADYARGGGRPAGLTDTLPVTPTGPGASMPNTFPLHHSKWTRYWMEIKLRQPHTAFTEWNAAYNVTVGPNPNDPDGKWHMVSVWIADETRDAQRMLYRVPLGWKVGERADYRVRSFHFEMNTSSPRGSTTGPIVGYARNFVMLHNYSLPAKDPETDRFLFQRPRR